MSRENQVGQRMHAETGTSVQEIRLVLTIKFVRSILLLHQVILPVVFALQEDIAQ
jgi:hypothetical protein